MESATGYRLIWSTLRVESSPKKIQETINFCRKLKILIFFLEKLSNVQLYPSNGLWHIDDVTIDSNFDSGNLGNVEMNGDPISDEDSIDRRQGRRPG